MQTETIHILKNLLTNAVQDGRYCVGNQSGAMAREYRLLYDRISHQAHSIEYNEGLPEGTLDTPALTDLKAWVDKCAAYDAEE